MRYFLELSYDGTHYSGFQVQDGQETIQSQVTKALETLFRQSFSLTGSSRTDAGVHALQNFFHFDSSLELTPKHQYNLNAILPSDIAITSIYRVADDAHCRFDAVQRSYKYLIYRQKDPFMVNRGWLFPYPVNKDLLDRMAMVLMEYSDFTSFSKRNSQVKTYICSIRSSYWEEGADGALTYRITSNRFLRGMIRGIVGSMMRIARTEVSVQEGEQLMRSIIESKDCTHADFTTPAKGLYLESVVYPDDMLHIIQ